MTSNRFSILILGQPRVFVTYESPHGRPQDMAARPKPTIRLEQNIHYLMILLKVDFEIGQPLGYPSPKLAQGLVHHLVCLYRTDLGICQQQLVDFWIDWLPGA